jgi:uncharacterized protein YyaL (SSP411 family)
MAYRFTKNAQFLLAARKAADYFITKLPADRVPYWDFNAPGIPADTVPRDASAAAIAASGLLELSTLVGATDSLRYRDSAVSILRGLCATKYRAPAMQASILNHSTGNWPQKSEVNVGLIYADYYFLQALLRYEQYSGLSTAVKQPEFTFRKSSQAAFQMRPVHTLPVDLLGRRVGALSAGSSAGVFIVPAANDKQQPYELRSVVTK